MITAFREIKQSTSTTRYVDSLIIIFIKKCTDRFEFIYSSFKNFLRIVTLTLIVIKTKGASLKTKVNERWRASKIYKLHEFLLERGN